MSNTGINALYDDALLLIFTRIFVPWESLKAPGRGLDLPWFQQLRTAKTVMLVCRRWHPLALPHLYRHICLYRVGQLPALARTVRSATLLYGPLIHTIRLTCFVPDPFLSITARSLSCLFTHCTALHKVAFQEAITVPRMFEMLWGVGRSSSLFNKGPEHASEPSLVLSSCVAELAFFNDGRQTLAPVPVALIASLPNLVKLSINTLDDITSDTYSSNSVQLHKLEDLTVYAGPKNSQLPLHWSMPQLRRLRIRPRIFGRHFPVGASKITNLADFCNTYAHQLLHVDLGYHKITWSLVQDIIGRCPSVRHLALSLPGPETHLESPKHLRPVSYIDLFAQEHPTGASQWRPVIPESVSAELIKGWGKIRVIDLSLLDSIPDLPTRLPPEEEMGEGRREYQLHGMRVVRTVNAVYQYPLYEDDKDEDEAFWLLGLTNTPDSHGEGSESSLDGDQVSVWTITTEQSGGSDSDGSSWCDNTSDISNSAPSDDSDLEIDHDGPEYTTVTVIESMQLSVETVSWMVTQSASEAGGLRSVQALQVSEDEALQLYSDSLALN